jgi:hypothetical protein
MRAAMIKAFGGRRRRARQDPGSGRQRPRAARYRRRCGQERRYACRFRRDPGAHRGNLSSVLIARSGSSRPAGWKGASRPSRNDLSRSRTLRCACRLCIADVHSNQSPFSRFLALTCKLSARIFRGVSSLPCPPSRCRGSGPRSCQEGLSECPRAEDGPESASHRTLFLTFTQQLLAGAIGLADALHTMFSRRRIRRRSRYDPSSRAWFAANLANALQEYYLGNGNRREVPAARCLQEVAMGWSKTAGSVAGRRSAST